MAARILGMSPPEHFLSSLLVRQQANPRQLNRAIALSRSQDVRHRPAFATSVAAAPGSSPAGYRYRGSSGLDHSAARLDRLRSSFQQQRQLLAFKSARLRAVTSTLNRQLALALADGVKAGSLAEAAQLSRKEVMHAGLAFDDLYPSGTPARQHLAAVRDLGHEFSAMKLSKAVTEAEQLELLAATRRQGLMDDFELALLTGLRHDQIRRLTRGVGTHGAASRRSARSQ